MLEPSEDAITLLGEVRIRIVLLASEGLGDKEIALQLGFSENNVREHWKKIRKLLGVNGRIPAVLKALRIAYSQDFDLLREELSDAKARAARLEAENEALRTDNRRATTLLNQAQRRAASMPEGGRLHDLFLQASQVARAVSYEIGSLNPVSYRRFSPSASLFGIDIEETLDGRRTFFEIIHPEDLESLTRLSLDARFLPDERYMYLFRVLMPTPRWVLDIHQALYRPSGEFEGVIGLAVDVQEMVDAGVIHPEVRRITVSEAPILGHAPAVAGVVFTRIR